VLYPGQRADPRGRIKAGSISSFIAAERLCHPRREHRPFFIYYSMFGMQRGRPGGAADTRTRGFLGGTAGALPREGLQHQDGHSHLLSLRCPTDLALPRNRGILGDGIRRMCDGESVLLPRGDRTCHAMRGHGVLEELAAGRRRRKPGAGAADWRRRHPEQLLWRSRSSKDFDVAADVAPQFPGYRGATPATLNRLHPGEAKAPRHSAWRRPRVIVVASDYVKAMADSIDRWIPRGSRRSAPTASGAREGRVAARSSRWTPDIVVATLGDLARDGVIEAKRREESHQDLRSAKPNPAVS
jgi:pyruvate dehydrogenase E1 component